MSKRGYISRYLLILKKLRLNSYSTFEELQSYIECQFEYLQDGDDTLSIGFSKRTLQRDIKEIKSLFGIDIEYSKSQKGYHISSDESENMNFQRRLEAFEMFHALNLYKDLSQFIHFEKREPTRTEYLSDVIQAIEGKRKIKFSHQKFWSENASHRVVEPYALKEFRNRWYILAKDKSGVIKSFGLDRISKLETTADTFEYPKDFNVNERYKYSFGIIDPGDEAPEEIILSFNPVQGKYIKTLHLHHSQKVIKDNNEETRILLELCVTHDFLMELLSFGANMKVIKPESLANQVKAVYRNALNQYKVD